jgi:hypothetical protein
MRVCARPLPVSLPHPCDDPPVNELAGVHTRPCASGPPSRTLLITYPPSDVPSCGGGQGLPHHIGDKGAYQSRRLHPRADQVKLCKVGLGAIIAQIPPPLAYTYILGRIRSNYNVGRAPRRAGGTSEPRVRGVGLSLTPDHILKPGASSGFRRRLHTRRN